MPQICQCGGRQITLMPDSNSNGLWCSRCRAMIDLQNVKLLPKELIQEIQNWNNIYTEITIDKDYRAPTGYNKQGLLLAQQITNYYPCSMFVEKERE